MNHTAAVPDATSTGRPPIELNGPAPDFEANTTHGPIRLATWETGKWVILFSHPADFTPVCTTEFVEFARRYDDFERRGVALPGNSVDSIYSPIAWIRNIEEKFEVTIRFPVIADVDQHVSRLYGMIHQPSAVAAAVRCVFFIDPERRVRATMHYPLTVGRNFDEILRVIDALQCVDERGVACPADWVPGQEVIVPPPVTQKTAEERVRMTDIHVTDWYFSKKKI